jgi:hypothetical protein
MDGRYECHETKKRSHLTASSVVNDEAIHSKAGALGVSNCSVDSRTSNARFFACWNASKGEMIFKYLSL